ncbi:MAG: lysostaphin resistance A-like protein [Caulobacteraceae bacterium]
MVYYETFVMLFTFLLINAPVFLALNRYIFGSLNIYKKLIFAVVYWVPALFTQQLMPFLGVIVLLIWHHSKEGNDIGIRDFNPWLTSFRDIAIVAVWAAIFKILISQLNKLYVYALAVFLKYEAVPQDIVGEFNRGELYYKVMLFILVVILAPFVEEYIFRYYIYDKVLLPQMPAAAAALISTLLFTLLHYNISGIPTFFGLGLFCTFMYEKKGYYGAVTTHMVSNLMTAILLI